MAEGHHRRETTAFGRVGLLAGHEYRRVVERNRRSIRIITVALVRRRHPAKTRSDSRTAARRRQYLRQRSRRETAIGRQPFPPLLRTRE